MSRKRRHRRLRKKVSGTADRPRLCVFRSHRHTYAQLIDDGVGETLVQAKDTEVDGGGSKKELARRTGSLLAERALEKGVEEVVFDRAGYRFHGRVRALAEGAREGGLIF